MSQPTSLNPEVATGSGLNRIAESCGAARLTIAQSIRRSTDPHRAAITAFSRQEILRGQNIHVYHFEDESFLSFAVTYSAVEDGVVA